jgi:hypothetical protein
VIPTGVQLQIRDAARAFAQKEIVPHAAEWDRTCTVPVHVLRAMGPLGLVKRGQARINDSLIRAWPLFLRAWPLFRSLEG